MTARRLFGYALWFASATAEAQTTPPPMDVPSGARVLPVAPSAAPSPGASIAAGSGIDAIGQAPIVGGDRVRARERSLDEAFRQAVDTAAASFFGPEGLAAHAGVLRLTVEPQARAYVSSYRVLEEGETANVFRVHVAAVLDLARLEHDLSPRASTRAARAAQDKAVVCLSLPAAPQPKAAAQTPAPVTAPAAPAPKNAALAAASTTATAPPSPVVSGKSTDPRPAPPGGPPTPSAPPAPAIPAAVSAAMSSLATALKVRGVEAILSPTVCAPALPALSSSEARAAEAARPAGAQGAILGVVQLDEAISIRGTALFGVHAVADLRVVDRQGRVVGAPAKGMDDGWNGDSATAAAIAAAAAVVRALAALEGPVGALWPTESARTLAVRVTGVRTYSDVQLFQRSALALPGVTAVEPRVVGTEAFEFLVRGEANAQRFAAGLGRVADAARFQAAARGEHALDVLVLPAGGSPYPYGTSGNLPAGSSEAPR